METLYVKRGCVVQAEPFDPARTDQGVNILLDESGGILCATMTARGRLTNVRPGDVIITDSYGPYPISEPSFVAMYQALSEIVAPTFSEIAPALPPETVPALSAVPAAGTLVGGTQ